MKKFSLLVHQGARIRAHYLSLKPFIRLALMLLPALPLSLSAQPGLQWTSSINVGSGAPPQEWAGWMYDVIVTSSGNYLGVGFARDDEANSNSLRQPSYAVVTPTGALLRDEVLGPVMGDLWNVVEASSAYYAVGRRGDFSTQKGPLVKVNK